MCSLKWATVEEKDSKMTNTNRENKKTSVNVAEKGWGGCAERQKAQENRLLLHVRGATSLLPGQLTDVMVSMHSFYSAVAGASMRGGVSAGRSAACRSVGGSEFSGSECGKFKCRRVGARRAGACKQKAFYI